MPRERRPRFRATGFWISPRRHSDFAWAWGTRFLVALGNALGTLYLLFFLTDEVHYPSPEDGLLILAGSPTWRAAITAAAILGGGYGIYLAVDAALVTQVLPAVTDRAKDLGVVNIANSAPQVLAPALAAPIVSALVPDPLGPLTDPRPDQQRARPRPDAAGILGLVPRAADLREATGLSFGLLPSGPTASVHDVPGVGLGHATLVLDEPDPPDGRGVVRTGVSVLDIAGDGFGSPVPAGGAVLNGVGECTGFVTVAEDGLIESPVFLTSTMQVGRVYDAACTLMARRDPRVGVEDVVIPVVAECDDSGLSDPRWARVSDADVERAWDAARAAAGSGRPPEEGCVGAGTGMECLGFKGGIGTASRVLPDGHVLAAVVLTNFGEAERLTICGIPVGAQILSSSSPDGRSANGRSSEGPSLRGERGSCIVVLVTDAPIDQHGCGRVARRAGLGLARTGSVANHGSGEIFLALATGLRGDRGGPAAGAAIQGPALNPYFAAAVEATEEAVITSLLAATTTTGRGGRTVEALSLDAVLAAIGARARIPR